MAFSASLWTHLPIPYYCHNCKFSPLSLYVRQKSLSIIPCVRRSSTFHIIKSVFENSKSGTNGYGASQPARALLERLFEQTLKLEEGMSTNSHLAYDVQSGLNLETLESDIRSAFEALKKKEEDLQEAERMVMLEQAELTNAKEELGHREKEIAAACSRQEKLEEELRQTNLRLISQAREIEDLKLQLRERDSDATASRMCLSLKEEELEKVRNDLMKKSEEAATAEAELKSKARLLDEANQVVVKQEIELLELQNILRLKEKELEMALSGQRLEVEKLKVTEAKLEARTRQWLLAQEELRKLGEEASRNMEEHNQTMEDFKRVKKLLAEMRSELASSQKSLASSRQKMVEGELLLEKQLAEVEEQKQAITSYMKSLKDAQMEVEGERVKLRTVEARNKELGKELSIERQLVESLREELHGKRSSLQQANQEISLLQLELGRKNAEFRETSNILQVKESELVEARLENQHLKSEQDSLWLILEERDLELCTARKRLAEVNAEVAELRMLMQSKEDELKHSASLLQEKEDFAQAMQHELSTAKRNCSEAECIIERIVDLTSKLVVFTKEDDTSSLQKLLQQESEDVTDDYSWQEKQLKTELELTRDNLKTKEMEVLAMQRALAVKDEELKTVLGKLDEKERELKQTKEEMLKDGNDLKKLYALAEERIGGRSIADLAIEKLQLEAAQLEVEAATSALEKLAEMSRQLVNKASMSVDFDADTSIFPQKGFDLRTRVENDKCFTTVKTEVARLSALTERLVQEAGIIGATD